MALRELGWRQLSSMFVFAIAVVVGAVLVLSSVPAFVRFLPGAPSEFWVLVSLAVLVEIFPLIVPHDRWQPSRLAVSLSLTFAMLLVWGPAVAIVVQALALGVAQLRVARPLPDFGADLARFTLAFAVAGVARQRVVRHTEIVGTDIRQFGLWVIFVSAVVWFLTNLGVIGLLVAVASPAARRPWVGPPLLYDLAVTGALLMLSPVLITSQSGWLIAFVAVPLGLSGLLSHVLLRHERHLNRDPVTAQHSPRGLAAALERMVAMSTLGSESRGIALLQVRLDGLTQVTNVFGQQATDDLLAQVGDRLSAEIVGARAIVGRVSVADFVILLPRTDSEQAEHVADAVARTLLAPIDVKGVVFSVQPTIGITVAPPEGADLSVLTTRAETALMDAQRIGVLIQTAGKYDEVAARKRLDLLIDLRGALERPERTGELYVLYQPQVCIADGELAGVEALVRWRHPVRGPVDTSDMIVTAEASGLIESITTRILDDVCAQLAEWAAAGLRLRVSANVSAKDLANDGFAEEVQERLQRHSLAAGQVVLEVTETTLLASTATVCRNFGALLDLGVELSLDDFGTGHASLQQLRRYPLREVKIDRSYITAMHTSVPDRAIITSITGLAADLGMRVVAEGVEDEATAVALGRIGPIIAQGWHYGRPMTAQQLFDWLDSRSNQTSTTLTETLPTPHR